MWQVMVIAGDEYDEICKIIKEKFPSIQLRMTHNMMQIHNSLVYIDIHHNFSSIRGYKPDILYCDKDKLDPITYEEIIQPSMIYGMIRPLKEFKNKLHFKVED